MAPRYKRPLQKKPFAPSEQPRSNRAFKICVFVLIVIVSIYYICKSGVGAEPKPDPEPSPGILVAKDPVQKPFTGSKVVKVKGYTLKLMTSFSIWARVLSVHDYTSDREAELSPVDFALGWGKMSDSDILEQMKITESGRWYFWHYEHKLPIDNTYIIQHSANMHMIPANDEVKEILKEVRKNDIINIRGYLVYITGEDNYHWNSSLTRKDTGNHSCEVVLVENIYIEQHDGTP